MSNRQVAIQSLKVVLPENLADQPHCSVASDLLAVACSNTGALLASMLKSVKCKKGYSSYAFSRGVDPNHPATFMQVLMHGYTRR